MVLGGEYRVARKPPDNGKHDRPHHRRAVKQHDCCHNEHNGKHEQLEHQAVTRIFFELDLVGFLIGAEPLVNLIIGAYEGLDFFLIAPTIDGVVTFERGIAKHDAPLAGKASLHATPSLASFGALTFCTCISLSQKAGYWPYSNTNCLREVLLSPRTFLLRHLLLVMMYYAYYV